MNAATITALAAASTAVIGAITALIAVLKHKNNPGAHADVGGTSSAKDSTTRPGA